MADTASVEVNATVEIGYLVSTPSTSGANGKVLGVEDGELKWIDISQTNASIEQSISELKTGLSDVTEKAESLSSKQDSSDEAFSKYKEETNKTITDLSESMTNTDTAIKNDLTNTKNTLSSTKEQVDYLSNKQESSDSEITALKVASSSHADALEVDDEGLVYLLNNGERIAGPYGPFAGGGKGTGGSTNNATLTVSNTTGWLSTTIADGDKCYLNFTWSSLEDNMATGDGSVKITVNGSQKVVLNATQGDITIDVSSYLEAGSNTVRVTISDVYSNSKTIAFSINCVQISISSSFDASTPYTDEILFSYNPVGSLSKTIHFILDGTEIDSLTTTVSARQLTYTIPKQEHGSHTFECYFTCEINGETITSNVLHYEIMCVDPINNLPIITTTFEDKSVPQYSTVQIKYIVYDPTNISAAIKIIVNNIQKASLTVDRTEQTFSYRADVMGDITVEIVCGKTTKTITFTVTQSDIDVAAETNQLSLYLSSAGRSNNEKDPTSWKSGDTKATLSDFNFASDGWVNDSDGITVLRVSGDARVTIPYKLFSTDYRSTGKTIEIEFATRDVMNYDVSIISCMNDNRGLVITPQLATLKSEQSTIEMQYKENEHVRLSFVVEKRSENRLIYIYVNGIMSGAVQYPESDDFAQTTPADITIGSNECTTDIYCIRVYDNDLTRTQLLENWMADTQDITTLLARYNRNNVYDEYGNIVIAKLPTYLPYMILEGESLPQYKGDKKTISVVYVDPSDDSKSFTASGVVANVQGTSSQYYPRKNYKLQYKKGFDMTKSGEHVKKYAMNADAIPVNAFTMKADVASSEGCNNTELVRYYNSTCVYKTPPQKENSKVRQGIDGFPIVIFWNNGTETTFIGKYNFNNDKGTEEVYGFTDGDESWEILNNTSDRVIWKSDDFDSTVTDENGKSTPAWLNDFEARFPDTDPVYTDSTQLKALATFLKSTDRDAATGDKLTKAVTYGTGDDAVTYTKDTAEYRLAKFKNELGNYCELESTEFYYLFTELFLMVDSRAKNAFPTFMGSEVTS